MSKDIDAVNLVRQVRDDIYEQTKGMSTGELVEFFHPKMSSESENLQTVRRYLAAIERGAGFEELAEFFTPDVVQIEYPNRFVAEGARRDLAQLREAGERGKKVVESQRYEIRTAIASGDTVALEVEWTATLKVPVGTLPAGGQMRAHFGVFLQLRDGRIAAQRNYDCFDPF